MSTKPETGLELVRMLETHHPSCASHMPGGHCECYVSDFGQSAARLIRKLAVVAMIAEEFCERVERGEVNHVRSVVTHAKFRTALANLGLVRV